MPFPCVPGFLPPVSSRSVAIPLSIRSLPRLVVPAIILVGTTVVGAVRLGPLPPIGHLLDPVHGVWAVARAAELPTTWRGRIGGLGAPVDVRYDSRSVPHIFAASESDAYRALGYVVARDRLFQVELQSRAGAGTLSELIGAAGIPLDREMRELGLPAAAERQYAALDTASPTGRVLRAYADGINAWIDQMSAADLPIEFRLLGRQPARWAPINAYQLLNRMALTLSYSSTEVTRQRLARFVGDTTARVLMPVHSPLQQPIVPTSNPDPHFLSALLPPLIAPLPGTPRDTTRDGALDLAAGNGIDSLAVMGDRDVGSNNWAVSPRRTRSGSALLAGDPHLDLSLPSIWYEAHLVVPGQLDVSGVTIPGGPPIIIGFTRDVAWTFTNTGADVVDFYAETVDDTARPRRYRVDGVWRPMTVRVERYRDPTGRILAIDTMLATHRGPLRHLGGQWLSMRWTALEGGGALPALLAMSHAHSTAEWLRATATYDVPAQNMLVADRAGSIAIRSTGSFPLRPGDGRGDVIRDGSTSASDWTGRLPVDRFPTAIDPPQGYLASANQEPIDPSASTNAMYLGADWESPWRAIRINSLLRSDSAVTPDDMRRWQTDPGSARADFFMPYFLSAARNEVNRGHDTPDLHEASRLLSDWDGRYTKLNQRAVLFEGAMRELSRRLTTAITAQPARRRLTISSAVIAELLHDSTAVWWSELAERGATRPVDGLAYRDALLATSLAAAFDSVRSRYGQAAAGGWRWDRLQHANIYHLLHIPAFSRLNLPVQGGTETLNPSSGTGIHGPSWRMVVQLGHEVHAWAVYPGGQSGNPVSSHYADRLPLWVGGSLDPVRTPQTASDLTPLDLQSTLTLTPQR